MPILAHTTTINTNPTPIFQLSSLADGDLLNWNSTTQSFENTATLPAQYLTTASNQGTGEDVFKQKTVNDLEFKTLIAGSDITITAGTNDLTIATTASTHITAGQNLGGGQGPFGAITGTTMQFKELIGTAPITVTSSANALTFTSTAEANTISSMGSGTDGETLVSTKAGADIPFRRIKAGQNIALTSETNDVEVSLTPAMAGTGHYGKLLQAGDNGTLETLATASTFNFSQGISGTTTHHRTLQTTGSGGTLQWSSLPGAMIAQFRIDFTSTGDFSTGTFLPSGWSYDNVGNVCTITHTTGVMPKMISYFGHKTSDNSFHYRFPTGAYEIVVKRGDIQDKFSFSVTAGIAGSENSGYALVQVMF
jgi:hypothetical protein